MADKVNILLVDNRQDNLLALEASLNRIHQTIIKCASADAAQEFLLHNEAAVILIDLTASSNDGFHTAELIRRQDKPRQTPIIFIAEAGCIDAELNRGYSLGVVDYIFKPFAAEVLASKVSVFVTIFEQHRQLQRQSSVLKAEWDFADAVLDTVDGFVLVLDSEGRIMRANRAFEDVIGFSSEQAEGHFLYEYLEEEDAAKRFLNEAKGPKSCREYWLATGTTRRLISWCCTQLGKEVAGTEKLVVTGRDMTELRQRTEELEGFTYSVSHDMRAPVRAIDGFTRILIEEYANSLDEEGRRLLDIVRQNTEKMGQLIDGLLALSRLGRERLIFTDIDMAELAKAAFEEQKTAGGRHRDITFKLGELSSAYGDKRLITQVFHNLLANAIKFTRNQPAATIEVGYQTGAGEDIYFVRDNGVGFDMNHAQKLFGTFQRLHAATEFEGSGIGLATVHRIIDRHGGRVWAEAELDNGATFYFSLPAREMRKAS